MGLLGLAKISYFYSSIHSRFGLVNKILNHHRSISPPSHLPVVVSSWLASISSFNTGTTPENSLNLRYARRKRRIHFHSSQPPRQYRRRSRGFCQVSPFLQFLHSWGPLLFLEIQLFDFYLFSLPLFVRFSIHGSIHFTSW